MDILKYICIGILVITS